MICRRGHEYRGDENYRARQGWCPVCFAEVKRRYRASDKGLATEARYRATPSAQQTKRARNARTNPRRIRANRLYLGFCGFTVSETEAMLDGSTD